MSEQEKIKQIITDAEYAATSGTGDAIITITNYYYREEERVAPTESTDTADENLPCPYRGLFHFGPNDAQYFFGREIFIEELYRATKTRNFIPVLGASGSGKSSVVLAGLVPKLQQVENWKFTHFRPSEGDDLFHALALALVPLFMPELIGDDKLRETRKIAQSLRNETYPLSYIFTEIQHNYPNHRILLIADQFEEIYTLCNDEAIRRKFLDCLLASLRTPTSLSSASTVLVTTMRVDFLGNALSYPPFADLLRNGDVKIRSMKHEELLEVIEKPAHKLGVTFEGGLVERILNDVEEQPGNLPLLEFALTELWNKRTGKQLTHKIYEDIGQVEGALARHADEEYGKLTDEQKKEVRRIFIQLVRPGEGKEDTRRIAVKKELGEQSWSLVKRLADVRLVVTSRNVTEQETVEVVHEALIQNWGQLRQWMDTDRNFRVWQERLRVAMRQWETTNKDKDSLLRGVALVNAEENLRERPKDLIYEQEFILQSIKERNRLKKLQFITIFSTTVILVGFSIFAGFQWRQAEIQKIRVLRESSEAFLSSNQQLEALLNSLQAGKSLNHPLFKGFSSNELRTEVTKNLRKVYYKIKERNRIKKPVGSLVSITPDGQIMVAENIPQPLTYLLNSEGRHVTPFPNFQASFNPINYSPGIIYSPNGRFIAIADIADEPWNKDKYGTVSLWDGEKHKLIRFTKHQGGVKKISFSSNIKKIATVDGKNTVHLWDIESQAEIQEFKDYTDKNIVGIGFDQNNKLLIATADKKENKLSLWSSENQQILHDLYGDGDSNKEFSRVIFSPDGKRIVIEYGIDSEYYTDGDRNIEIFLWNYLEYDQNSSLILLSFESLPLENDDIFMSMSHDGKQLATALNNSNVRFWDLEDKILEWSEIPQKAISVNLSADAKKLAIVIQDGTVGLLDLKSQKFTPLSAITDKVSQVSLSADGKKLATANQDGTVALWNLESQNSLHLIKMFSSGDMLKKIEAIIKVEFSPDSNKLAIVSQGVDKKGSSSQIVSLWNLKTQKIQLEKQIVSFDTIIFNANSELQFINADGLGQNPTQLLDWNGNQILQFKDNSLCPILTYPKDLNQNIISNNEKSGLIASVIDDQVCLWDIEGNYLARFKVPQSNINDISFNSDGSLMAIAVDNGSILLWKIGDLDQLITRGCDWIQDYINNPNINISKEERSICDGVK